MNKLISIIMPVKNGMNYLEEALKGIKSQNMNVEIIVIDDGSNDDTSLLAKKYGCIVIKNEISKGQVVCKNMGLKIAKGDYIIFHDHDDILTDGALERFYKEITENDDYDVIQAKGKDFISNDALNKNKVINEMPHYGILPGVVFIKKCVFDKIGLFDETISAGEAISFFSKLEKYGIKVKKIDFVSLNRRIHDTNYGSTNRKNEYKDYLSILRNKFLKK